MSEDNDREILELTKEEREYEELLNHIQTLLSTLSGRAFVKYLFKSFEVGEVPHIMCRGEDLLDRTSFLRAGNSIYKLIMAASPDIGGQILTIIEKEKNHVIKTLNSKI